MEIAEYFARQDTPMVDSPVGRLMVRVLEKNPEMDCDAARTEARRLLDVAAKTKTFKIPSVLSPAAQEAHKAALAEYWKSRAAQTVPKAA